MQLPLDLEQAIKEELAESDYRSLTRAARHLSDQYRFGERGAGSPKVDESDARHRTSAYIAARMPATFAASCEVMGKIAGVINPMEIRSLLDLGAGPGTCGWAAGQYFGLARGIEAVEPDPFFREVGKRLAGRSRSASIRATAWFDCDLTGLPDLARRTMTVTEDGPGSPGEGFKEERHRGPVGRRDLVTLAYVLGELKAGQLERALEIAWSTAGKFLAVIEPGTPRGFQTILSARTALIRQGGNVIAPCPGAVGCPMTRGDWCHFGARVNRTAIHRRLKAGVLPYEDEKFSYVVVARNPIGPLSSRVIRRPVKLKGHVKLLLCTGSGLKEVTVARGDAERYRLARKAEWGDGFPFEEPMF